MTITTENFETFGEFRSNYLFDEDFYPILVQKVNHETDEGEHSLELVLIAVNDLELSKVTVDQYPGKVELDVFLVDIVRYFKQATRPK